MARRKIKIKRIENATSRQVTFTKRRGGLLKKAHDLSVLCDAEVGVIVFSSKGKLFQFANPSSMQSVVERYMRSCGHSESPEKFDNNASSSAHDGTDRVTQFTEKLKALQSIFIGDNLERLSSRDLIRLEQQIHDSLGRIRAKKEELFIEQLQEIKEKEGGLVAEIAATRRAVNGSSDVLGKIVEFASSDFTGSEEAVAEGHIRHSCAGTPQLDASVSPQGNSDTFIAQSNHAAEGVPVAKRSRLTEDLNKSPPHCEEWTRD